MKIIVSYDVSVVSEGGKRRLRRVAKICVNYGLRVQNSVFECEVDWTQYLDLKSAILSEIDSEHDSIRIYNLGNRYQEKIEHFGTKRTPNLKDDVLFF